MPTSTTNPIQGLLNATINAMGNLYGRYLDEREYEPLSSYQPVVAGLLAPYGATVTKMTGRPWGCRFTMNGVEYQYRVTLTKATIKRVA